MESSKNLYGNGEGMYTFLDRTYFDVVSKLHDALVEQDVKYAIVGGTGVQARIVDAITRQGSKSIKECKTELRNIFRPTKDIDIATLNGTTEKMFLTGRQVAEFCGIGYDHKIPRALKFEFVKEKPIYIQYQLSKDDFQGLPEMYDSVVDSAERLNMRYMGKRGIELMVAKPEHLIASKLTRNSPKDVVDISHLLTVYANQKLPINYEDIRANLKGNNKGELFANLERICLDLGIAV